MPPWTSVILAPVLSLVIPGVAFNYRCCTILSLAADYCLVLEFGQMKRPGENHRRVFLSA